MTKQWTLDHTLEADSRLIVSLGLCQLRLMDDRRFPWLLLIPQRPGMTEMHDLTPLDQTMLTFEMGMAGKALKAASACEKINIAALGNKVRQLHVHVVARSAGDAAWPGPVWGCGSPEPYGDDRRRSLISSILSHL
jgi:diadenosine tetraphosphate (Ap4A) HIT family hydrolase